MPARDLSHNIVRTALVKDGWTITDDPYVIRYDDATLFADLGAERPLAAERNGECIVVEIKGFTGPSPMREFETALGQYELYRGLIELTDPRRVLFLAVADTTFHTFIQRPAIQAIVRRNSLRFVVVHLANEEILQWTS